MRYQTRNGGRHPSSIQAEGRGVAHSVARVLTQSLPHTAWHSVSHPQAKWVLLARSYLRIYYPKLLQRDRFFGENRDLSMAVEHLLPGQQTRSPTGANLL